MPINSSGIFSRLFSWVADRDAGVQILASKMDDEMNGMAAAINSVTAGEVPLRGPMRTVNGTATAPAWSFTGDTNTGVFRQTTGQLGLSAGGVRGQLLTSTSAQFSVPVTLAEDPTVALHAATKQYVDGRTVSAGAGMTGSGENGTIVNLGTPSTITSTSTNSVTSTSHTHAISGATIRALIAEGASGQVGTYMFLRNNGPTTLSTGSSTAGSNLSSTQHDALSGGAVQSGTWTVMGQCRSGDASLFLRIS